MVEIKMADVSTENERVRAEKAFLASAAKLITDKTWDTNWNIIAGMFMFSDEAERTYRLFRSQTFRDPDYPDCVYRFFMLSYNVNPARAVAMATYIIQDMKTHNLLDNSDIERYPVIKAFLAEKGVQKLSVVMPKAREIRYLDIKELPDDFYYSLVDSINRSYAFGVYLAVRILVRKLLENLLVDILRKKFGTKNLDLFYDKAHGKFHNFNVLLKNFEEKLNEFKIIIPSLAKDFVAKLDHYRERGNSAAHTLEIELKGDNLEKEKEELEFLIKTLVRLYKNI